jgi:hypothetical protein
VFEKQKILVVKHTRLVVRVRFYNDGTVDMCTTRDHKNGYWNFKKIDAQLSEGTF